MTNPLIKHGLEDDSERYKYAMVANLAMQAKDQTSALKSLERLAMGMGVNRTSDAKSFSESVLKAQDIETYLGKYQDDLNKTKVSELFTKYSSSLSKIVGGNEDNLLRDFGNETYGNIELTVKDASEIINSKGKNFSEEQKKEAEKVLDKYQLIYGLLQKFESEKIQKLFSSVREETLKEGINEYYKEKEKKEDSPQS
jgi:biotin-(acetyl-CoA carboxylase) ligase